MNCMTFTVKQGGLTMDRALEILILKAIEIIKREKAKGDLQ